MKIMEWVGCIFEFSNSMRLGMGWVPFSMSSSVQWGWGRREWGDLRMPLKAESTNESY